MNVHKLELKSENLFTMFVFYTVKLVFKNITNEAETAPYDKRVNELLIKLSRLVETAPYDKTC